MNYIEQELPKAGDKVVVGLSGGVDSSLTALLLKEKGCNVTGVTMSLWDGSLPELKEGQKLKESCFSPGEEKNISELKEFCKQIGIDYHVIDVKEQYKKEVLEYFKSEYRRGRTPNPCIRCNNRIKFGALLNGVRELGIDYDFFCTGHYAKVVRPENGIFGGEEKPFMIATASDVAKDQTYFLYRLSSETLEKVRFPLAWSKKSDVYEMAKNAHLSAAFREESQDFIGEEYFDLLFSDKPSKPGDIIDIDGHVLGRHKGIEHYTIGQRRGLGVAVNYPVYVQAIDAKNNVVVLAPENALYSDGLIADDFVWAGEKKPDTSEKPLEAMVKIRLASRMVKAKIEKSGDDWKVVFDEAQKAVAPGQSVVLYDKMDEKTSVIIGGGVIKEAVKNT